MRVAVTGGGGFIGSRVVEELLGRQHAVVVIDRSVGVNLFSNEAYRELMKADAVIHLAGMLGTEELFADPIGAIRMNIEGAARVLQACTQGEARYVSITMPSVWANIYQATKRCAFDFAEAYRQHRGVPVSHVRAFNVFGPGQKVGSPQKIIPTFSDRAWHGAPLPIWGNGQQTVDLVYVDDVARMLVDALDFGDGEVFDAGTGVEHTVALVAGMVAQFVTNAGGPGMPASPRDALEMLPMRRGETLDTRLAASGEGWDLLSWHPVWDQDQLAKTVEAYRPVDL